VRHALAHQLGLPAVAEPLTPAEALDWPRCTAAIFASPLEWEPGTAVGEHALTYTNILGAILRGATGETIGDAVRGLGHDVHFGLSTADIARCAEVEHGAPDWPHEAVHGHGELWARALGNPAGLLDPAVLNGPAWRTGELPAVNAHATARGLAGLYHALPDLLPADLLAEALAPQAEGVDRLLEEDATWTLGWRRDEGWIGMGGIGGSSLTNVFPLSEERNGNTFGVLKLYLYDDSYAWKFVPVAGKTYTDSGSTACHSRPGAQQSVPTSVGFAAQPSNTVAGATITPAVQVEVRDQFGARMTTATNSVTVAIGTNPAGGTLSGTKTVAAVNGVATGAGTQLALACDVRLMAAGARFVYREGRLGIIPSHGGVTRLVKLIPLARARDVILGEEELSAESAYRIGLISGVIEGDIIAAARDRVALMLERSPQVYAAAKRLLWLAASVDLESGMVAEGLAQSLLIGTDEHKQAVKELGQR